MANSFLLDGFVFKNASDYEHAKKEKETIAYLVAHTDMNDMKAVYKIYSRSVEKKLFQTVFGLKYLEELRKTLLDTGAATEDMLDPIPVEQIVMKEVAKMPMTIQNREQNEWQQALDKANNGSMIKNMVIGVLAIVVIAMFVITYKSQYSVFTYFTDYKEDMRSELVNEYEEWENSLEEREQNVTRKEAEIEQREQALKEQGE